MNFKYNQNAQIYPRAHIHILQINKYVIPLTFTVNVKRVRNEISSFKFRFTSQGIINVTYSNNNRNSISKLIEI